MSQVRVTKQFKDDFDVWANNALRFGDFTKDEMTEFKEMLRRDMQPGPDQLREGLEVITAKGITPAMIDNYEDRIKAWTDYFSIRANEIRQMIKVAA